MKTIKKLLALTLVLCMVFCLSVAVFAEGEGGTTPTEPTTPGTNTYKDMETVTITKKYELTNAETISPAETFTFVNVTCTGIESAGIDPTTQMPVAAASAPIPTIASVSYEKGEAGSNTMAKEITITLPSYTIVGVYTYTFYENNNNTAGVDYREAPITLKVTVIEQDGKVRVAGVHTEGDGETKSDSFNNTYSAGKLSVSKTVTGNLGDRDNKYFEFKVKFTKPEGKNLKSDITYQTKVGEMDTTISESNWGSDGTVEVTIQLKHDQTITFTNIPYGVTYEVTETAAEGYTTTATGDTGKIENATQTAAFTNNKDGEIDTGITLDSLPYILALAVAFGGAVVLFTRKRHVED